MKDVICLDSLASQGEEVISQKLLSLKREEFPVGYSLEVEYNSDIINNQNYPGKFLTTFVKLISEIDIPSFFVKIKSSYKNINRDLDYLANIYKNGKIDYYNSEVKFVFQVENNINDTFCILPWFHFYFNPQGNVLPCCTADEKITLGSYVTKDFDFNNKKIKEFRRSLLNNIEVPHCNSCYKIEKNNLQSPRQRFNKVFKNKINKDLKETVDQFKLTYLDIRLSNVCNLKCRMCSGKFSNRIAQEDYEIWGSSEYIQSSNFLNIDEYFLDIIKENVNYLEKIYFAGGEPLINPVHYKILKLLEENNKTDLNLFYNTNFSILNYKKDSVIDYWKKFSDVIIGASIDLLGPASNYVRNGIDYNTLENNYFILKDNCPNVKFTISSVLSLFNVFNLCDLQKHWIIKNQLPANCLNFNVLHDPEEMSLKCLPAEYKHQAAEKIHKHIDYLKEIDNATHLVKKWNTAIDFMFSEDHSYMLKKFFTINDERDKFRNQKFEDYFPEYKNLRSHI